MPFDESVTGYCIMFIERLNEGVSSQLLGQNSLISPELYIEIGWQKLS